jgi:hypothetical protein
MSNNLIGLIDVDSKIPNLALMKLSAYYKAQGRQVHLNMLTKETAFPSTPGKILGSVVFERNREKARALEALYAKIVYGGTGWGLKTELPADVEAMRPDYSLYRPEHLYPRMTGIGTRAQKMGKAEVLVKAGIGFTSRGCIRKCKFCRVPEKEGDLRVVGNIADLVNPASSTLILLNNNLTAQPNVLEELAEVRRLRLHLDITQGIDVRLMTPEIADALSKVSHVRSLKYAWDLMTSEKLVWRGIEILSRFVKKYRHLCYTLVGFNTSFAEDMYRFRRLTGNQVDPYVMLYDDCRDTRLRHFARWVNSRIYKACPDFEQYQYWVRDRDTYFNGTIGWAADAA